MLTRRDFLKLSAITFGTLAMPKLPSLQNVNNINTDTKIKLGRICAGDEGARFELKAEPNLNASNLGYVWRDEIVEWKQEVIANQLDYNRYNQKWVETPNGYIYGPYVQPVKNLPNQPVSMLPENSDGTLGMWVEITVPVVDIKPVGNKDNTQFWIKEKNVPRIYYSQVFWAYDVRQVNGAWEYLLMQKIGAFPDSYWVDATACRPITSEEIEPINPGIGEKHIIVDLNHHTLTCFEGKREVFYTIITSGAKVGGKWLTPTGMHTIWRKMISTHMSSGALTGPFDLSGIGWTTLFDTNGAAIHSVYWHNDFGSPLSHGCINCKPEDAKWIWRWSQPSVDYYPGDLINQGWGNSTLVEVIG